MRKPEPTLKLVELEPFEFEFDRIPPARAAALGRAAYNATVAWLAEQEKQKKEDKK